MKNFILASLILFASVFAQANADHTKEVLKQKIINMAKSFEGQGDPDYSKQRALEPLVEQLLAVAPQPPLKDRLNLLYGPWRQVWGPYDYRNNDRGVDPELGIEEIYQVIFAGGYYYNTSYLYKNGDKNQKRIGLLRGKFKLDKKDPDAIQVKFTKYPGTTVKPAGLELWQLPPLAENGTLQNKITIVPTWVVQLFFGGGALREVYTDENLRIAFGSNGKNFQDETIYIMTRANFLFDQKSELELLPE